MLNISLQEAKDKLPELINLVEQGEEVFIIGNNKTKIKLVSFTEKPKKRMFGQHRDLAIMSEDFNSPLPDSFWLDTQPEKLSKTAMEICQVIDNQLYLSMANS